MSIRSTYHHLLVGVAVIGRVDVGEGVAERTGGLVGVGDGVLDQLGIEPSARLDLGQLDDRGVRKIAQGAVRLDRSEVVARTLFDDVGDHEITPIGSELGKRRDDAEVGITLRQVKSAQLLLVRCQPVRVIGVVRLQEAEDSASLARVHFLAQPSVGEMRIAEDVDRADLGEVALVDLEHHVDAVLVELNDLGIDARGESSLPPVKLEDPVDIGANCAPGEDLARSELDLRRDLVVLEALVALEDDAVDDRVFADIDDQVAGIGAGDGDVGEELGRVKIL